MLERSSLRALERGANRAVPHHGRIAMASQPQDRAVYEQTLQLSQNEYRRAVHLEPGIIREDSKGWCRDLLGYARKRRLNDN